MASARRACVYRGVPAILQPEICKIQRGLPSAPSNPAESFRFQIGHSRRRVAELFPLLAAGTTFHENSPLVGYRHPSVGGRTSRVDIPPTAEPANLHSPGGSRRTQAVPALECLSPSH